MQEKGTLSISYPSDMYRGCGWLPEKILHNPTCAHSSTEFSLLCVQLPMSLSFLSWFWFPSPSSFHLTDISSRPLHKVFCLWDLSAHISAQVILTKIWILEGSNCRNKSQITIIKITKLPCQLTIFVSLHAAYIFKRKKKKGTLASANFVDHMSITLSWCLCLLAD